MRMTNFIKVLALIAIVGMAFTGCQKDAGVEPGEKQKNVVTHGLSDIPTNFDGEQFMYKMQVKKSRNKGAWIGHDNPALIPWYIESDTVFVEGSSKKYIAMKVKRSDSPGDYFYIMIRNLSIKGNHEGKYKAYENDYSYAEKYGYLYDFEEANYLSRRVYMRLPIVYNGVEYPDKARCGAKLPSREDLKYVFGHDLPTLYGENGVTGPSNHPSLKYYDAFIGGLSSANEVKYTMTGYSDNFDYPERFFHKGKMHFWTSEQSSQYAHYPLQILRSYYDEQEVFNYLAYMNAGHADRYGNGVRYVFYPPVY